MKKIVYISDLTKKLKLLRHKYDLTQEDVANALEIHRSTYAYYEIGRTCLLYTSEAKAIYAYLASFAGAGESSFPTRDKILSGLNLGKDRYYSHFKLLIQEGYILSLIHI